jgi:hypothetical protein
MKILIVTQGQELTDYFQRFASLDDKVQMNFTVINKIDELVINDLHHYQWIFLAQNLLQAPQNPQPFFEKIIKDKISLTLMGEDIKGYFLIHQKYNSLQFLKTPLSYEDFENQLTLWFWDLNDKPHQKRHLTKGEYLIHEGEESDKMYWVVSGKFAVIKKNERHENIILAEIQPGELIGEMGFIESLPRTATVKALEESDILEINQEDFLTLFKNQPKWFKSLIINLTKRLRHSNSAIANLKHPESAVELKQDDINELFNF